MTTGTRDTSPLKSQKKKRIININISEAHSSRHALRWVFTLLRHKYFLNFTISTSIYESNTANNLDQPQKHNSTHAISESDLESDPPESNSESKSTSRSITPNSPDSRDVEKSDDDIETIEDDVESTASQLEGFQQEMMFPLESSPAPNTKQIAYLSHLEQPMPSATCSGSNTSLQAVETN